MQSVITKTYDTLGLYITACIPLVAVLTKVIMAAKM